MEKKYIKPTYSSKFIKNYTEELPVDPESTVKAFTDYQNKPCLISKSTDEDLYVILQRDGTPTGWAQVKITESLGTNKKITAFDASKDLTSNKVRIAIGLTREGNKNELYIADYLDTKDATWENFSSKKDFWKSISLDSLESNSVIINRVLVYKEDVWFSTKKATEKENFDAKYYKIEGETAKRYEFKLPENGREIQDIALGQWKNKRGVFLLYEVGNQQTLLFISYPDEEYTNQTMKCRFDCEGKKINSIALIEDTSSGNHYLCAAGEALFIFKSGNADELIKGEHLASSTDKVDLDYLQVAQNKDTTSCWFLNKIDGSLFYMHNELENGNWSIPVILKKNVKNFACLRGQNIRNHLFYVDSVDARLNHFWEDEVSTLWSETFVPLQGTGNIKESLCYLTQVSFPNFDQIDSDQSILNIKSSNNLYVTINEKTYQIGPNYSPQIDFNGEDLFILSTVNSGFVDAALQIIGDMLEQPFVVDMAEFIYEKMKDLVKNNCLGLKDLKDINGLPIIPDEYKDKDDFLKNTLTEILNFFLDFREKCGPGGCETKKTPTASSVNPSESLLLQKTPILQSWGRPVDMIIITLKTSIEAQISLGALVGAMIAGAFAGGKTGAFAGPYGALAGVCIGALVGGLLVATVHGVIYVVKTIRKDKENISEEEWKKINTETNSPRVVIGRYDDCKAVMTIYDQESKELNAIFDSSHIISWINTIFKFIDINIPAISGKNPPRIKNPPRKGKDDDDDDNNECVYKALLIDG